jgi:hypothetical protein
MTHPTHEHSPFNMLAEIEEPGKELILNNGTPGKHNAGRPAYFIIQRECLNSL